MKTLLLLLIVSTAYAEDTIPKFSPNPIRNKILTQRWIDSIAKSYAGVKRDSLVKAFDIKRRKLVKR